MKAVIANISDVVEYRVDMVHDFLKLQNWDVTVLTSDYRHIEKKKRMDEKEDYVMIDTLPYKKNISFTRLYSHYNFSLKVRKILKTMEFDLLYIIVPANSLAVIAKEYPSKKVIIDIIDLWPESFPIPFTNLFPFSIWANMRNHNLQYADVIILECNLYKEKLSKWIKNKNVYTIYWSHKEEYVEYRETETLAKELTLCYLGSINNIIDIPAIADMVEKLAMKQKVVVKIIGDGEQKVQFVTALKTAGAEVVDYGKVYEYERKKEIVDTCHFGINIMKSTVVVGLSMKSIDYLEMGLPIINSLQGDIRNVINEYKCGFNMEDVANIYDLKLYNVLFRRNARKAYEDLFSYKAYINNMVKIFNNIE